MTNHSQDHYSMKKTVKAERDSHMRDSRMSKIRVNEEASRRVTTTEAGLRKKSTLSKKSGGEIRRNAT